MDKDKQIGSIMEIQTKYWCVFYIPGSFFAETTALEVDSPDFVPTPDQWPKRAYGYYINSVDIAHIDGKEFKSQYQKIGPVRYRGKIWSIDDVRAALANRDPRVTEILLSNMENNDYGHVIECSQGMVPFNEKQDIWVGE